MKYAGFSADLCLLQVLRPGIPSSRGTCCDTRNLCSHIGESQAGELGHGKDKGIQFLLNKAVMERSSFITSNKFMKNKMREYSTYSFLIIKSSSAPLCCPGFLEVLPRRAS